MVAIRSPMSPGGGWRRISLYSDYLKLVHSHIDAGGAFEAIAISCLCLDVLLLHML